jgi:hypothetical protein
VSVRSIYEAAQRKKALVTLYRVSRIETEKHEVARFDEL